MAEAVPFYRGPGYFATLLFCLIHQVIVANAETLSVRPNYAFSNYFGSGLYSSSDQDLTVFNIPIYYEPEQQTRNKYRFRLPISFGFYDFSLAGLDDIDLPDSVSTLTLTAGIEYDYWVNTGLKISPFLDLGVSENLHANERAYIFATGLTAAYYFSGWGERHIWLSRLQRAGYNATSSEIADGFASLETGVDLILPWHFTWFDRAMFISVYGINYWYFLDLEFSSETLAPFSETTAQELGVTLGLEKPLDFYLFDIPRIGVGIRHSNNLNVIRLLFDYPLD